MELQKIRPKCRTTDIMNPQKFPNEGSASSFIIQVWENIVGISNLIKGTKVPYGCGNVNYLPVKLSGK